MIPSQLQCGVDYLKLDKLNFSTVKSIGSTVAQWGRWSVREVILPLILMDLLTSPIRKTFDGLIFIVSNLGNAILGNREEAQAEKGLRAFTWSIITNTEEKLEKIDAVFSSVLGIRTAKEVQKLLSEGRYDPDAVYKQISENYALRRGFIEIIRYSSLDLIKENVLNSVSQNLALRVLIYVGFAGVFAFGKNFLALAIVSGYLKGLLERIEAINSHWNDEMAMRKSFGDFFEIYLSDESQQLFADLDKKYAKNDQYTEDRTKYIEGDDSDWAPKNLSFMGYPVSQKVKKSPLEIDGLDLLEMFNESSPTFFEDILQTVYEESSALGLMETQIDQNSSIKVKIITERVLREIAHLRRTEKNPEKLKEFEKIEFELTRK